MTKFLGIGRSVLLPLLELAVLALERLQVRLGRRRDVLALRVGPVAGYASWPAA
jgi:hypothetical protein